MAKLAADLENWMAKLPPKLRHIPLIHLAIPGSHDSTTYGISETSKIAPDADPILKPLSQILGCIVKPIITQWSITQESNIRQQLYFGVRYFDLRIATRQDRDGFYFVHAMFAEEITAVFREMLAFLNQHPEEVLILDCQHFYAFKQYDHDRFMEILLKFFGTKLLPYSSDTTMREGPNTLSSNFWPSETFPNPWANTMKVPYLIEFLTQQLQQRDSNFGYISQCILTPDATTILSNLFSNLQQHCFLPLEQKKYEWLNNQCPGPSGVNIIISNFAEFQDDEFTKTVIGLNEKLLDL